LRNWRHITGKKPKKVNWFWGDGGNKKSPQFSQTQKTTANALGRENAGTKRRGWGPGGKKIRGTVEWALGTFQKEKNKTDNSQQAEKVKN